MAYRSYVRVREAVWDDAFEVMVIRRSLDDDGASRKEYLIPQEIDSDTLSYRTADPAEHIPVATARIDRQEAQSLLNILWAFGLRPRGESGNSDTLNALRHHVDDLRSLLFHKEGIAIDKR